MRNLHNMRINAQTCVNLRIMRKHSSNGNYCLKLLAIPTRLCPVSALPSRPAPSLPGVDADAFAHRRRAAGVEATKHRPYFLRRLAAFVEAHFFEGRDAAPVRCGGSADRRRSTE